VARVGLDVGKGLLVSRKHGRSDLGRAFSPSLGVLSKAPAVVVPGPAPHGAVPTGGQSRTRSGGAGGSQKVGGLAASGGRKAKGWEQSWPRCEVPSQQPGDAHAGTRLRPLPLSAEPGGYAGSPSAGGPRREAGRPAGAGRDRAVGAGEGPQGLGGERGESPEGSGAPTLGGDGTCEASPGGTTRHPRG